jgi:putative membrane protein
MNGYWGNMWAGPWFWLILLAIIAIVVIALLNRSKSTSDRTRLQETALDILKKRYARGEISKEEYEQMKDEINQS